MPYLHSCGIIITKYRCVRKSIAQNQRYHSGTVCIYLRKFLCQKTTCEYNIYHIIYYIMSLKRKHLSDAFLPREAPKRCTLSSSR